MAYGYSSLAFPQIQTFTLDVYRIKEFHQPSGKDLLGTWSGFDGSLYPKHEGRDLRNANGMEQISTIINVYNLYQMDTK